MQESADRLDRVREEGEEITCRAAQLLLDPVVESAVRPRTASPRRRRRSALARRQRPRRGWRRGGARGLRRCGSRTVASRAARRRRAGCRRTRSAALFIHCSTRSTASGSFCRSSAPCERRVGASQAPKPMRRPKKVRTMSAAPTPRGIRSRSSRSTPAEMAIANSTPRKVTRNSALANQSSGAPGTSPARAPAARTTSRLRQPTCGHVAHRDVRASAVSSAPSDRPRCVLGAWTWHRGREWDRSCVELGSGARDGRWSSCVQTRVTRSCEALHYREI